MMVLGIWNLMLAIGRCCAQGRPASSLTSIASLAALRSAAY